MTMTKCNYHSNNECLCVCHGGSVILHDKHCCIACKLCGFKETCSHLDKQECNCKCHLLEKTINHDIPCCTQCYVCFRRFI